MSIKLNVGAGEDPALTPEGYVAIDRKQGGEAFPLQTNDGKVVADGSVDEIRASHVLEHLGHRQTLDVLKEWARALKPGGVLKVAVPDLDWIVNAYADGQGTKWPLESFLFGGQSDGDDYHKAMFNEQKLATLLVQAGFGEIQRWTSEVQDCASLPVSLNLMGTKGAGTYPKLRGKVAAAFSVPRFGPLDPMFCAMQTFTAMDIPAIRKSGVFWHQCLTDCMEELVEKTKYILTIDYDSLFSPSDVFRLYRLMEEHPEADAICPVQSGRDRATPLMTVAGEDGKNRAILSMEEMGRDLLELRTGHFGLTMIRTESLKKLPKPWFLAQPDPSGAWGEGRVDSDIYFWLRFREAGFRLFQANRVSIGHGQWMASFPDRNLESRHLYVSEYLTHGKPEWAWR